MAKTRYIKRVLGNLYRDLVQPEVELAKQTARVRARAKSAKIPKRMTEGRRYDEMLSRAYKNRLYNPIRQSRINIPPGAEIPEIDKRRRRNRSASAKKAWMTRKRKYGKSGKGKRGGSRRRV
jgi:hypothetical protein